MKESTFAPLKTWVAFPVLARFWMFPVRNWPLIIFFIIISLILSQGLQTIIKALKNC